MASGFGIEALPEEDHGVLTSRTATKVTRGVKRS